MTSRNELVSERGDNCGIVIKIKMWWALNRSLKYFYLIICFPYEVLELYCMFVKMLEVLEMHAYSTYPFIMFIITECCIWSCNMREWSRGYICKPRFSLDFWWWNFMMKFYLHDGIPLFYTIPNSWGQINDFVSHNCFVMKFPLQQFDVENLILSNEKFILQKFGVMWYNSYNMKFAFIMNDRITFCCSLCLAPVWTVLWILWYIIQ